MSENKDKEDEKPIVAKTAVDLQRLKLMKLMKNPEKPVILPERPKAKNTPTVPEFVRNVMGSSAGAGSGEFHVYRHLRRKEYARQKFIQEKGRKELLDEEYHLKLEENRKKAEEATAKKRAKRLKRKEKNKLKKRMKTGNEKNNEKNHSESEEENSDEEAASETDNTSEHVPTDATNVNRIENEDANEGQNALQSQSDKDAIDGSSENVPKNEVSSNECKQTEASEDENRNEEIKAENMQTQPVQSAIEKQSDES